MKQSENLLSDQNHNAPWFPSDDWTVGQWSAVCWGRLKHRCVCLVFQGNWVGWGYSAPHAYGSALLCNLWSFALFTPHFPPFLLVCVFTVHVHQSSCVVKGFCPVWHLDAFSSSSSARTHRRYITPLFYVMTAAALRLYLPSRVFPAPRPHRRPASFTIPASCKRPV